MIHVPRVASAKPGALPGHVPGAAPISFIYGDFTLEAIYLARDLNRDGDLREPGARAVFFDGSNASGLAAPSGTVLDLHVTPRGVAFYGDNPTDSVYRLVDRNGDGDAQDAGEASVWLHLQSLNPSSSPFEISFTGEVDADLLRLSQRFGRTILEMDANADASDGFQAQSLAVLVGVRGVSLDALIDNVLV